MVKHLWPGFLDDEEEYDRVIAFWRAEIRKAAAAVGQLDQWTIDPALVFADGVTPHPRDGNPILVARSNAHRRSIEVIQSPPEADQVEISAWLGPADNPQRAGMLTLNLALSEEAAGIAQDLIRMWMQPSVAEEAIKLRLQEMARDAAV